MTEGVANERTKNTYEYYLIWSMPNDKFWFVTMCDPITFFFSPLAFTSISAIHNNFSGIVRKILNLITVSWEFKILKKKDP